MSAASRLPPPASRSKLVEVAPLTGQLYEFVHRVSAARPGQPAQPGQVAVVRGKLDQLTDLVGVTAARQPDHGSEVIAVHGRASPSR